MPTIKDVKGQVERIVGIDGTKKRNRRNGSSGDDASSYMEWLTECLDDLRTKSTVKQVAIGTTVGWASGVVCGRFGRTAATAVGGTVICLHLANNYGYITINWNRVNGDVDKVKQELQKKASQEGRQWVTKVNQLVAENFLVAGGFAGGFLIGLASS